MSEALLSKRPQDCQVNGLGLWWSSHVMGLEFDPKACTDFSNVVNTLLISITASATILLQ